MDPPEEHKTTFYTLGDVGTPEHANELAVARLKPNDRCLVLRSGGIFTFAKILSRQGRGPETHILELQVNSNGATKTIVGKLNICAKFVRPLQSRVQRDPPPL